MLRAVIHLLLVHVGTAFADDSRSCAAGAFHTGQAFSGSEPYEVLKMRGDNAKKTCCDLCQRNITGCGAYFLKSTTASGQPAVKSVCHLYNLASAASLATLGCGLHSCATAVFPSTIKAEPPVQATVVAAAAAAATPECDHCTSIGCDHAKCDPALVAEAAHFQCLSDNPWAESGGVLAAADPTAFVVLMRAVSPLHYAITWALFRIPRSISFNETVRRAEPHIESRMAAYSSRIAEMRSAFRSRQRFFEFCVSCGDDIFTLARAFGMNTSRLLEWLPEGE
eukprot:gene6589-9258_t